MAAAAAATERPRGSIAAIITRFRAGAVDGAVDGAIGTSPNTGAQT